MRRLELVVFTLAVVLVWLVPASAGAQQFVDGLAQPVFNVTGANRSRTTSGSRFRTSTPIATASTIASASRSADRRHRTPACSCRWCMIASPYSGGTLPFPQHDINVPLYVPGKPGRRRLRATCRSAAAGSDAAAGTYYGTERIRRSPTSATSGYQSYFLPRGFIFVYAQSLGTGLSTGCPTIGGDEESLAMKAVIDWFNGRGTGFDAAGNAGDRVLDDRRHRDDRHVVRRHAAARRRLAPASKDSRRSCPIAGVSSYYDHRRSYGTVINSNPTIGTDADTLFDNILRGGNPEACALHARADRVAQGSHDRRLQRVVGRAQLHQGRRATSSAAVLISHGLNDLNTKPRMYAQALGRRSRRTTCPRKIWLNQGGHGDGANSRRARRRGATS